MLLSLVAACQERGNEVDRWRLSEPEVRIGAADGDTGQILHKVGGVREDRHGRVYVIQIFNPGIAVFAPDGRRIATLGGTGGGPADFSIPNTIHSRGDTVWIGDAGAGKISRFLAEAPADSPPVFVETTLLREVVADLLQRFGRLDAQGFATDGRLLVTTMREDSIRVLIGADTLPFFRFARNAIGRVSVADRHLSFVQPLADDPITGFDPEARLAYLLDRPVDPLRLTLVDPVSGSRREVVLPSRTHPIPPERVESALDGIVDAFRGSGQNLAEIRDGIRTVLHVPDRTHDISRVALSRDSLLAVTFDHPETRRREVMLFDLRDDRLLGFLELASTQSISTLNRSHAWILEKDADDVEYLVRRRLLPP